MARFTSINTAVLDRFGRLIDLSWVKDTKLGPVDLVRFQYAYDRSSNRLYERNLISTGSNPDVDSLFGFDELNRLTQFEMGQLNGGGTSISSPQLTQDWVLDETGNYVESNQDIVEVLEQTRTHNQVNEITGISETVGASWAIPAHDDAGNMTVIPQPNSLTSSYDAVWDGWNRLVSLSDDNDLIAEYEYDGLNRRIVIREHEAEASSGSSPSHASEASEASEEPVSSEEPVPSEMSDVPIFSELGGFDEAFSIESEIAISEVPSEEASVVVSEAESSGGHHPARTRHLYYSNRSQVLEDRIDSSTDAHQQYVWNTGYIDDLILRDRDTDGNGTLDERLYALTDLRYSVMALANPSGTIVERFRYDAHGHASVMDSSFARRPESLYDWEYRYTGREQDLNTGFYYFRARYYHAELGRFISRDPIGYVDGMSLYRGYLVVNDLDPFGNWKVYRVSSESQAIAVSEKGDTVNTLAQKINLDPNNARLWMKPVWPEMQGGIPQDIDAEIPCTQLFRVPNTITVGVAKVNILGRAGMGNVPEFIRDNLVAKGFKVKFYDWVRRGPWQQSDIDKSFMTAYGFAIFGHGTKEVGTVKNKCKLLNLFGTGEGAGSVPIGGDDGSNAFPGVVTTDIFNKGQLGFLAVKACHAGDAGSSWPDVASENAHKAHTVWIDGKGLNFAFTGHSAIRKAVQNVPGSD